MTQAERRRKDSTNVGFFLVASEILRYLMVKLKILVGSLLLIFQMSAVCLECERSIKKCDAEVRHGFCK